MIYEYEYTDTFGGEVSLPCVASYESCTDSNTCEMCMAAYVSDMESMERCRDGDDSEQELMENISND